MFDLTLLIHVFFQLCISDLLFFHCIIFIISKVHANLCIVNLNNFCDNTVQEITVMGDDKYRSGIIDQICFQPGNGIQIQVVCRLIKQEDIRTCKQ